MSSHGEESRISPGSLLAGKWHVDELLGEGGMATVWAATHRNGMRAAIKVLRQELSGNSEVVRRFLREGYVANRIEHPGVVKVLDDHVTDDGIVFLVMELLEGETAEHRWDIMDGQLPPREVVEIMIGVLEVLEVAHGIGVVHRDLKPDNIFLLEGGGIKLLDFGIARLREVGGLDSRTKTGTMLGTPAFMPPEQALGYWDEVDVRSDVFALGATMWTLLTGDSVHPCKTVQELLVAACTRQARPIRSELPHVGEPLAEVVDRALRFEADDRWPHAGAMLAALRALNDVSAEVVPPARPVDARSLISPMTTAPTGFKTTAAPTTSRHVPAPRRRRGGVFVAVGLFACAFAVGGYALLSGGGSHAEAEAVPAARSAPDTTSPRAAAGPPSDTVEQVEKVEMVEQVEKVEPAASIDPTSEPEDVPTPSAMAARSTTPHAARTRKPPRLPPAPASPTPPPPPKPKCNDIFDPRCLQ